MVPLTQIPPKIPFFHHLIAENQVLPLVPARHLCAGCPLSQQVQHIVPIVP